MELVVSAFLPGYKVCYSLSLGPGFTLRPELVFQPPFPKEKNWREAKSLDLRKSYLSEAGAYLRVDKIFENIAR